jgi:endonuclease/exonuclease/phosphatase family metal-dependent hydrolase
MTRLLRRLVCLIAATAPFVTAPATASSASATPHTVRLVTFNVLKDLGHAKWQADWNRLAGQADIVFLQEAVNVRVRTLANRRAWEVRQATGRYADDVALAFRASVVRSISNFHVVRMLTHRSCRPDLVVGTRYLATAHVVLDDGRALTIAVTHLPPGSCTNDTYQRMMSHVHAWAQAHQSQLALGADWNQQVKNDPGNISRDTRLRPHGIGIDGFQVNMSLAVTGTRALGTDADYYSDHVPVQVTIRR